MGIIAVLLAAGVAVRPKSVDQYLAKYNIELPLKRMPVDIFPANLPVIYVCQPYGGMDPANGRADHQLLRIPLPLYQRHPSRRKQNVQGNALMKLQFHPGTNMAQAMAETINYESLASVQPEPSRRS